MKEENWTRFWPWWTEDIHGHNIPYCLTKLWCGQYNISSDAFILTNRNALFSSVLPTYSCAIEPHHNHKTVTLLNATCLVNLIHNALQGVNNWVFRWTIFYPLNQKYLFVPFKNQIISFWVSKRSYFSSNFIKRVSLKTVGSYFYLFPSFRSFIFFL